MLEWNLGPNSGGGSRALSAEYDEAFRSASELGPQVYGRVTSFSDRLLEDLRTAARGESALSADSPLRVFAMSDQVNGEIREMVAAGRLTSRQAFDLTLICHAYFSHILLKIALKELLAVTEPPDLCRDRFQAGVMPLIISSPERGQRELKRGGCSAKVTEYGSGWFLVTLDYGLLCALQNVHLICSDVINKQATTEPRRFIRDYCEQFVSMDAQGVPPLPPRYTTGSRENLLGTGLLGGLTKQFVLAHELGHVIRYRRLGRRDAPGEEFDREFEADRAGLQLHLASSSLLKPPYDRLYRDGTIRTIADAKRWSEQRLREAVTPDLVFRSKAQNIPLQSLLPAKEIFRLSAEDVDLASVVEFWAFAAPFVVFRFFECWEFAHKNAGRPLPGTHPPFRDRANRLLEVFPNPTRQLVEGHVLPFLDQVFPSCPW
jgi:hypothetical protein